MAISRRRGSSVPSRSRALPSFANPSSAGGLWASIRNRFSAWSDPGDSGGAYGMRAMARPGRSQDLAVGRETGRQAVGVRVGLDLAERVVLEERPRDGGELAQPGDVDVRAAVVAVDHDGSPRGLGRLFELRRRLREEVAVRRRD